MILLLLPCNQGAKEGNYFPSGAWKQSLNLINKKGISKERIDFAAVDSIITRLDPVHDKETKGSIVLETEMDRVKGCDLRPKWNLFEESNYQFLKEHTKYCEIGLSRLVDKYELIIVTIGVRGYKYAIIRAIRNIYKDNIPPKFVIIDVGESPSYQNSAISLSFQIIYDYIQGRMIPLGKIIKPKNIEQEDKFLKRPRELPIEYVYWNLPIYELY